MSSVSRGLKVVLVKRTGYKVVIKSFYFAGKRPLHYTLELKSSKIPKLSSNQQLSLDGRLTSEFFPISCKTRCRVFCKGIRQSNMQEPRRPKRPKPRGMQA